MVWLVAGECWDGRGDVLVSLTLAEEALRHCVKGATSPRHCDLLEYVCVLTVAHPCSSLGRLQAIGDRTTGVTEWTLVIAVRT